MELNFNTILNIILLLTSVILLFNWLKARKRIREIEHKVDTLNGQSEADIYGRGKFSELGLMSAGIAHELSNPLSIILGRTQQLLKPGKEKDYEKGLQQIQKHAERMASVIKSVRDYIYRNEEEVETFIPLKDIVNDVLMFCGQRLKNHGIEFRTQNIDKIFVSGHKGQFEQAIMNLINNSFDAIDGLPEKWIEISGAQSEDHIEIFFKDSGHGVPIDVRKKMLEPFFSTKKGKGTGLGLPLVKGIAEKHGGDFSYIENAPNTTFLLELPRPTMNRYHH